jgi:hypothetical protein
VYAGLSLAMKPEAYVGMMDMVAALRRKPSADAPHEGFPQAEGSPVPDGADQPDPASSSEKGDIQ